MKFPLTSLLTWLLHTVGFFKRHLAVILMLGLIAAFGRVIQLGGFGEITSWMNISLEVVVESARILLFLYALGLADVRRGTLRIKRLFTDKISRRQQVRVARQTLKQHWLSVLCNVMVFLLIAAGINYLIDLLAYETCLYLSLKQDGILAADASEWTILLFFKNLSVIPFTLVFEAIFLLWITNKIQNRAPAL